LVTSTLGSVLLVLDTVIVLLLFVLVAGILRYLNVVQERLEATVPKVSRLRKGDTITSFELPHLGGGMFSSSDVIGHDVPVLLAILNDQCGSCEILAKQIAELAERPGGLPQIGWRVVMVWVGSPQSVAEKSYRSTVDLSVLIDERGTVVRQLLVSGFPSAIALDGSGRVLDQSSNPGPNWMYLTLEVDAPEKPLTDSIPVGRLMHRMDTQAHVVGEPRR
jgi:peroxiredoxin